MSTSIVIPVASDIGAYAPDVADDQVIEKGNYVPRLAQKVIDIATAASTDINALQAGTSSTAVNGVAMPAGGALATGAVLRATGIATAAYGAVNLADTDAVTGILPGANVAPAVAGVTSGVVTAADQTHINSTPTIQVATATLVAGTATINTVIVLGATSKIIADPAGVITGSTNFACVRELEASRVNGAASTATAVIEALSSDGTKDTDAAGAIWIIILTPHA